MISSFKSVSDIFGYEFKQVIVRRVIKSHPNYPCYFVVCHSNNDTESEILIDDTKGLLKMFKKSDSAIKTAEKIIINNVVTNPFIQFDLQRQHN